MNESFEELWHFCQHRREKPMVQIKEELAQIYDLINGGNCRNYLEVGSAEGDSLYILSHALIGSSPDITYVDLGEKHTEVHRNEIIKIMRSNGMKVRGIHGNSHLRSVVGEASVFGPYDVVMIDAGHELRDVIADAMVYGSMAKKFIIFHDILLNDVGNAFDWYVKMQGFKSVQKISAENSSYGFGVITL